MNDLIVAKVDRARMLLAEARDAADAKKVADIAHAAEVYAKRQKLSDEAIDYARAVKVDAMTLMGEMLKAAPKNEGTKGKLGPGPGRGKKAENGSVNKEPPFSPTPKLSDLGIGKKESSDAQALAQLAKDKPDLHAKVKAGEVTIPQARRIVQREEKREELKAKAAAAPAEAADSWRVVHGDCLAELAKLRKGSARLIFADPPYNIGIDYGEGEKADLLPDGEYMAWAAEWLRLCHTALAGDGSLWVLIGDEYAAEYGVAIKGAGFTVRAWVKWYETFGVNCPNNFNRCSRHLFYCVKDPRRFVFNADAVNRPSDRQAKYGDRRADPGGKIWDDVWVIPRLVGTAKERIPDFPTQLPLALLRPIVGCCTEPGDLVVDPFNGSGTTGVAAAEAGRRYVGIEKSERFAELARQRLLAATHEGA